MAGYLGSTAVFLSTTAADVTGDITVGGSVDGRDIAADGLKIDGYATVALLLASTEASRGVGAIWEAGGFRYIEVASGGNVATAGGIQLDVLDGAQGKPTLAFDPIQQGTGYYPNGTLTTGFRQHGTETSYSGHIINGDSVDQEAIAGSKVNGWKVVHSFGGGKGGRHGVYGVLNQTAISAAGAADRNYVGVQGQVISAVGDGGTAATFADGKGGYFGMSSIATIQAGALNLLNVTGGEFNTRIFAGASAAYVSGIQVVTKDEVKGNVYDCAIAISRGGAGTVGKTDGILIGNMNGSPALDTAGTMMRGTGPQTLNTLFDFQEWSPTWLMRAVNFDLSSSLLDLRGLNANANLGLGTEVSTPSLTFKSSVNGNAYDSRIIASGGSAGVGNGNLTYNAAIHGFTGQVRPNGDNTQLLGGAGNRWSQVHANQVHLGPASDRIIRAGTGSPEGAITAPVGSINLRTDGGAGTVLYVKESGTGNTGWVAK